jgi:hypothetical protein
MGKGGLQVTTTLNTTGRIRGPQAQTFLAQKLHVGPDPFADCRFESFSLYTQISWTLFELESFIGGTRIQDFHIGLIVDRVDTTSVVGLVNMGLPLVYPLLPNTRTRLVVCSKS